MRRSGGVCKSRQMEARPLGVVVGTWELSHLADALELS
jgi:hypothetical protein